MSLDTLWAVLSRFLHVGSAIVAVGGTVFQRFILAPALAALPEESRREVAGRILGRWRIVVHSSIALLLATGIYNATRTFPAHRGVPLYHGIFGVKILAALAVFGVAAVLTGKSARAEAMRRRSPAWMGVLVLLATFIVLLSGVLKNI